LSVFQKGFEKLDRRYPKRSQYVVMAFIVAIGYALSGVSQEDPAWSVACQAIAGAIVGPLAYALFRFLAGKVGKEDPL
jgi:hypothetical protein